MSEKLVVKLWCDNDQEKLVKALPSCNKIVHPPERDYIIVFGESSILADIEKCLNDVTNE